MRLALALAPGSKLPNGVVWRIKELVVELGKTIVKFGNQSAAGELLLVFAGVEVGALRNPPCLPRFRPMSGTESNKSKTASRGEISVQLSFRMPRRYIF